MDKNEVVQIIKDLDVPNKSELIRMATQLVDEWHIESKPRKTGEPYGDHPREVFGIISQIHPIPIYVYYSALGHDLREHGNSIEEAEKIIGKKAKDLVLGLTQDHIIFVKNNDLKKPYEIDEYHTAKKIYHSKFYEYWLKDNYLILVKLADLLHNNRTIEPLSNMKKLYYYDETKYFIDFYREHSVEMRRLYSTKDQPTTVAKWIHELEEILEREYPAVFEKCQIEIAEKNLE